MTTICASYQRSATDMVGIFLWKSHKDRNAIFVKVSFVKSGSLVAVRAGVSSRRLQVRQKNPISVQIAWLAAIAKIASLNDSTITAFRFPVYKHDCF